jgi:hypothetical protein
MRQPYCLAAILGAVTHTPGSFAATLGTLTSIHGSDDVRTGMGPSRRPASVTISAAAAPRRCGEMSAGKTTTTVATHRILLSSHRHVGSQRVPLRADRAMVPGNVQHHWGHGKRSHDRYLLRRGRRGGLTSRGHPTTLHRCFARCDHDCNPRGTRPQTARRPCETTNLGRATGMKSRPLTRTGAGSGTRRPTSPRMTRLFGTLTRTCPWHISTCLTAIPHDAWHST